MARGLVFQSPMSLIERQSIPATVRLAFEVHHYKVSYQNSGHLSRVWLDRIGYGLSYPWVHVHMHALHTGMGVGAPASFSRCLRKQARRLNISTTHTSHHTHACTHTHRQAHIHTSTHPHRSTHTHYTDTHKCL